MQVWFLIHLFIYILNEYSSNTFFSIKHILCVRQAIAMKHMSEYTHWLYVQETYVVYRHVNKF